MLGRAPVEGGQSAEGVENSLLGPAWVAPLCQGPGTCKCLPPLVSEQTRARSRGKESGHVWG